jgi:hypothetical protein
MLAALLVGLQGVDTVPLRFPRSRPRLAMRATTSDRRSRVHGLRSRDDRELARRRVQSPTAVLGDGDDVLDPNPNSSGR